MNISEGFIKRPIATSLLMAAIALGLGAGGEARRPLGLAVVGGLLVSQLLTLYLTPVVYLVIDRLRPARSRTTAALAPG